MKSEYKYVELAGPLKTRENVMNTTQIPVKCDCTGNVSLGLITSPSPYLLQNVMDKVILTTSKKQE
jgi:hypothetical protein